MPKKVGKFITFEGIEGSGKSTQLDHLMDHLSKFVPLGEIRHTKEPGGTPLGDRVRETLLDPHLHISPVAELFLYEAIRTEHVEQVIKPALAKGMWVLCDRFSDATVAYQGYGRGLPIDFIIQLNQVATGGVEPDLTLLLDCSEDVGLGRAFQRANSKGGRHLDRLEQEAKTFHHRVRQGYLKLAQQNPGRFIVIDAARDEEIVAQDMISKINHHYPLENLKKAGSR
ncbi:MAG: dTMP kinase [Deltaproteobacteria bacterium]|nr:dTMP kinase [Deltaproteobacteria bacterium]